LLAIIKNNGPQDMFYKLSAMHILHLHSIYEDYNEIKFARMAPCTQGLQEKFCKPEQDCFGAPWTG